ncbi:MAG: hypothetical protein KTR21_08255 [Rhodobacteraceae bacterium]|nr:hypothetical protein [Paracoccaceae bacterium]
MAGNIPAGEVVLYDDDHFYMGGVLAELLVQQGSHVTLVTPAPLVSHWTVNTLEQGFIQAKLMRMGVSVCTGETLAAIGQDAVSLQCVHTEKSQEIAADAVVLESARIANDNVFQELKQRRSEWAEAGAVSVQAIGDADALAPIAWATYAGLRYAEELDASDIGDALPFR